MLGWCSKSDTVMHNMWALHKRLCERSQCAKKTKTLWLWSTQGHRLYFTPLWQMLAPLNIFSCQHISQLFIPSLSTSHNEKKARRPWEPAMGDNFSIVSWCVFVYFSCFCLSIWREEGEPLAPLLSSPGFRHNCFLLLFLFCITTPGKRPHPCTSEWARQIQEMLPLCNLI